MLVNIKTIRAIFTTNSLARFQTGIKKNQIFKIDCISFVKIYKNVHLLVKLK